MKCQKIINSGHNKGQICERENCKNHNKNPSNSELNSNKEIFKCQSIIKNGKNKGVVCNKENCTKHKKITQDIKPTKNLCKEALLEYYKATCSYIKDIENICEKYNCKIRSIGFSGELSENLIKYALIEQCSLDCINSQIGGDLLTKKNDKWVKIECKCFTSIGPMSFGPTENWEILIILDAILYKENKFTIYKINLSNTSEEWQNLKITQNKTFKEAIKNKNNRPHFSFDILKKALNNKYIEVLAKNKSIEELINFTKESSDLNELTNNLLQKCKIETDKNIVV
jgi:hypothetical protein